MILKTAKINNRVEKISYHLNNKDLLRNLKNNSNLRRHKS